MAEKSAGQIPTPSLSKESESISSSANSRELEEGRIFRRGDLINGKYRLEDKIARGGMGKVYLATQLPLGRKVALKVLMPSKNPNSFRQRFLLEASTCAQLTYRHIVTVHDYGETEDGDLFMAMEYLDGENLGTILKRTGALSVERTCRIASQICRALRAAHRAGVVHRDLKPSNIMILADPEEEEELDFVKVVDFGLAKLFEDEQREVEITKTGAVLGSPRYMAPEQIRCKPVDPKTDIYSLGVIMYRMLTGVPPFDGVSTADILSQHLRDQPPGFEQVAPTRELPAELEVIVRRCLEKDPALRYQQVDELLADLKAAYRLFNQMSLSGDSMIFAPGDAALERSNSGEIGRTLADDLSVPPPASPPPPALSASAELEPAASSGSRKGAMMLVAALLVGALVLFFAWPRAPKEVALTTRPASVMVYSPSGTPLGKSPLKVKLSEDGLARVRVKQGEKLSQVFTVTPNNGEAVVVLAEVTPEPPKTIEVAPTKPPETRVEEVVKNPPKEPPQVDPEEAAQRRARAVAAARRRAARRRAQEARKRAETARVEPQVPEEAKAPEPEAPKKPKIMLLEDKRPQVGILEETSKPKIGILDADKTEKKPKVGTLD